MKAHLTVDMDNAAFGDGNADAELARILCNLATKVAGGEVTHETQSRYSCLACDLNGNLVGHLTVTGKHRQ